MDVKAILMMIVERYEEKSPLPPMKTRLIKLVYLTELEYYRRTGKRLTSLAWQFYHFRPYAAALEPYVTDEAFALFVNHLAKFLFKRELDKEVCAEMGSYRDLVLAELEAAKKKVEKE